MRKLLRIPLSAFDPRLTVKIARTQDELEAAYRLLQKCYVAAGLSKENSSGLRINLFSLLPDSTTVIVKFESEIIGTVSLFRDSKYGLFTDSEYEEENNILRAQSGKLVEVSALAVDPHFRSQGHAVSFLLMKFIYWYARFWMHGTHFVCTVHPRVFDFYRSIFGFKKMGRVVNYRGVEGNKGVYLQMSLAAQHTENLVRWHSSHPRSMPNFFLFTLDHRLHLPQHHHGQAIDPVMTPELIHYFAVEKTSVLGDLPAKQRQMLLDDYQQIFGRLGPLARFHESSREHAIRSEYRVNVHLPCLLVFDTGQVIESLVEDLSSKGCFTTISDLRVLEQIPFDAGLTLEIRNRNQLLQIRSKVRWKHIQKNFKHLGSGVGLQFDEPNNLIASFMEDLSKTLKIAS